MKKIVALITVLTIMITSTFSLSAKAYLCENNNQDMPPEHIYSFCRYLNSVFPSFDLDEFSGLSYMDFTKVCDYKKYTIYRYEFSTGDYEYSYTIGPVIFSIDSGYTDYYREHQEGIGIYLVNDKEVLSLSQAYETGIINLLNAGEFLDVLADYYNYSCKYKTDLDENGRLDIRDATLLQKYITKNTGDTYNIDCDFNCDRTININDVTELQKCIAGYILFR